MKATCSIDGCEKPVKASGWCSMHYTRKMRNGTTDLLVDSVDYEARFWSKVDRRGPDECWPWTGTILNSGYGQFFTRLKKWLAHRAAYTFAVGPIPDGFTIDHVKARGCAGKACVNPAHLEAVTMAENISRCESITTLNARKEVCPKCGGDYTGPRGDRFCWPCKAAYARWYKNRNRRTKPRRTAVQE